MSGNNNNEGNSNRFVCKVISVCCCVSSASSETQACSPTASKTAVYIDASTIVLRAPSGVSPSSDVGVFRAVAGVRRSPMVAFGVLLTPVIATLLSYRSSRVTYYTRRQPSMYFYTVTTHHSEHGAEERSSGSSHLNLRL
jgi:hypothetical protein